MRVAVTGSREWSDKPLVYQIMDDLHAKYVVEVVFHGDQRGLDGLVKLWALERGIPVFGCPYASAYGKQGGPIRNGWLLQFGEPDLLVAFPMAASSGTWDMVQKAKAAGVSVRIVKDHARD